MLHTMFTLYKLIQNITRKFFRQVKITYALHIRSVPVIAVSTIDESDGVCQLMTDKKH